MAGRRRKLVPSCDTLDIDVVLKADDCAYATVIRNTVDGEESPTRDNPALAHKFTARGIYVVDAKALEADGTQLRARRMVAISSRETGEPQSTTEPRVFR